jgi:hypothetical protein
MLHLKKGDKVVYTGNMPYKLANGQEVFEEGDELFVQSNVHVQKDFFRVVEEPKVEKDVILDKKEEVKVEEEVVQEKKEEPKKEKKSKKQ